MADCFLLVCFWLLACSGSIVEGEASVGQDSALSSRALDTSLFKSICWLPLSRIWASGGSSVRSSSWPRSSWIAVPMFLLMISSVEFFTNRDLESLPFAAAAGAPEERRRLRLFVDPSSAPVARFRANCVNFASKPLWFTRCPPPKNRLC